MAADKEADGYDDLFDADQDGVLEENLSETRSPAKNPVAEDDDDDDLMPATGRARNRSTFLDDDENSLGQ